MGYTVAKTMEDCKTDLSIALSWGVSAKNSLKNVNGLSPNQLVFGSNPNLPSNMDSKLQAHEGKTSSENCGKEFQCNACCTESIY